MTTWKFPGSGNGQGDAISDALATSGLWHEREAIAKRLYYKSAHNNSFAPWDSLGENSRRPWLKAAEREMKGEAS